MDRRQTVQRSLILNTVTDLCNHPTAQDVFDKVHEIFPSIGKATVYRNLNLLADEGSLKRVSAIEGPVHFDSTLCEHSHIECRVCKKVIDIDLLINEGNFDNIREQTGFSFIDRNLIISGICPECINTAK